MAVGLAVPGFESGEDLEREDMAEEKRQKTRTSVQEDAGPAREAK